MKIMWLSRHQPTPRQRKFLTIAWPDHELIIDNNSFSSADDIMSRYRAMGADELVVVAPLFVIRALTERGLRPLWAEMKSVKKSEIREGEEIVESSGRYYRFIRFWRVLGVKLILEDIDLRLTESDDEFKRIEWKPYQEE